MTVNDDRKPFRKPSAASFNPLDDNTIYGGDNIAFELPIKPSLLRENGSKSEPRPRSIILID